MNKNLKSMTGYGKAEGIVADQRLVVEVRSLNSKQLDLNARIPYFLRDQEMVYRSAVAEACVRGKVDIFIQSENVKGQGAPVLNTTLMNQYAALLKNFVQEQQLSDADVLSAVLRMPEVLKSEETTFADEQLKEVRVLLEQAIAALGQYRKQEGDALFNDIWQRVQLILHYRDQLEKPVQERDAKVRNRIKTSLEELIPADKVDENRFESELIYYLERLDISEEFQRLKTNCDHFLEELNGGAQGKKLGFIAQEMGREINTIGSKANDADIQRLVVMMKDELEKIKEQLNNVL
jgi:uncharacterized protein (TIGR00255 family)